MSRGKRFFICANREKIKAIEGDFDIAIFEGSQQKVFLDRDKMQRFQGEFRSENEVLQNLRQTYPNDTASRRFRTKPIS